MAENLPDSLTSDDSMPSQIMAQNVVQEESAILQENMEENINENISTSIETIPQQADSISTITTVSLSEEIATSCSLTAAEAVSVSTQVSVMPETDGEIGEQAILQASDGSVIEQDTLGDTSEAVTIAQETIHVAIGTEGLNEGIQISNNSIAQNTHSNLPPWANRLNDCELIGDSYRGYVTNEVELDLILTLHKQHTNSCWGTRQSPSSAKPSIRLMWKSQYVPYDGIPFLNTGRRATVMECQYGPRRKGVISKKLNEYSDEGNAGRKHHRPTCPARIYIKKVRKFPEFRIDPNLEGKNVRQAQERALTTLRLAGVETGGEERFYVQLPLPIAHEYHDNDELPLAIIDDSQGQRLNDQIVSKIQEFVARGLTGLYTIKHLLKEFVEKELFSGQEIPPRHNKAYFPTIIDIQNHIHQAQIALAAGTLLPLPPLTNIPIISPSLNKDRAKKRKNTDKTSQTVQGIQTAQAVASIQQVAEGMTVENAEHSGQTGQEVGQHSTAHDSLQEQLAKIQSDASRTGQPQQILITPAGNMQMNTNKDGQVVIVVTSNSVYTSQPGSETPTTFALTALPTSQITSLPPSSLGTLTSGNQAVLIAQQGENGTYLTHAPSDNILTVLNPGITGSADESGVLNMMAREGQITTTEEVTTQPSVPEQLLASQAAVAAVLNAAAASVGEAVVAKTGDQSQSTSITNENDEEGEPPAKRQAVAGFDLSSLVNQQMSETDIDQSQGTIQRHVITTAQLNAALQAQAATALNTGIPVTYRSTEDGKTVAVLTQSDIESSQESVTSTVLDSSALQGYHVINIPGEASAHLTEGTYDVRALDPVTMSTSHAVSMDTTTSVTTDGTTDVTIETSNPVTMGTASSLETSDPVTMETRISMESDNTPISIGTTTVSLESVTDVSMGTTVTPVAMETSESVFMETPTSSSENAAIPLSIESPRLLNSYTMSTKSVASDISGVIAQLPTSQADNTVVSEVTELGVNDCGSAEASANFCQGEESDSVAETTSTSEQE